MERPAKIQTFNFEEWKQKLRQKKPETQPEDRALDMHEVVMRVGASRSSINRWRRAGTFPWGKKYGANMRRWLESEIKAWEASREG
ncbi:AlpA family phage regulatory protein [Candidatus Thiothrix sp. Deng01]|uniref:AlpA family phage regulatory protein n=2 Tax=Candidatus Thiothrix phosphatis TaxID=3112415 RepID=A0ABU6CRP9_9GAMM|nr:AlpA family phage regulatory protein [Candidatus Thiothrix sp. Deng01]